MTNATLTDLAARIALLEDERDIRLTLERYGYSLDYGREADWVDCFLPDGVYDMHMRPMTEEIGRSYSFGQVHEKGVRFQGREVLAKFASFHTRAPMYYHKHIVGDVVITRGGDPDKADVVSYCVRLDEIGNRREVTAFGRYFDKMVRCADGRWRFAERVIDVESMERRPGAEVKP